jgi:hypothetical protein
MRTPVCCPSNKTHYIYISLFREISIKNISLFIIMKKKDYIIWILKTKTTVYNDDDKKSTLVVTFHIQYLSTRFFCYSDSPKVFCFMNKKLKSSLFSRTYILFLKRNYFLLNKKLFTNAYGFIYFYFRKKINQNRTHIRAHL